MKKPFLLLSLGLLGLLTGCPGPTTPSFWLVLNPASGSAAAATSASTTAVLTPQNGFTASVSLALVSPPVGIGLSGGPANISSTSAVNAPLTLAVGRTVTPGNYALSVQATSGSLTVTTPYTLTVTPISGTQLWLKQFGSSGSDDISGVSVASDGSVYVGGNTGGAFPGFTNAGGYDAFLAKHDSNGNQVWLRQFGSSGGDDIIGVSAASDGSVYVGGNTGGAFPGFTNAGGSDPFFTKYAH